MDAADGNIKYKKFLLGLIKRITFSHGRELFVSHCQGDTLTANFESILRLSWDQLKS